MSQTQAQRIASLLRGIVETFDNHKKLAEERRPKPKGRRKWRLPPVYGAIGVYADAARPMLTDLEEGNIYRKDPLVPAKEFFSLFVRAQRAAHAEDPKWHSNPQLSRHAWLPTKWHAIKDAFHSQPIGKEATVPVPRFWPGGDYPYGLNPTPQRDDPPPVLKRSRKAPLPPIIELPEEEAT